MVAEVTLVMVSYRIEWSMKEVLKQGVETRLMPRPSQSKQELPILSQSKQELPFSVINDALCNHPDRIGIERHGFVCSRRWMLP
jgi:hypothetical protein